MLAESPTIDVRQATAATNIRADEIDRIPKGRDFQSLVTLAAGANMESRSGGISIDGASAAENKWYLDGIDTTNLRTGVSATPFLTDFISEVQVKSSGYAAEFGGATGGVVSIISKSGSNQFRGEGGLLPQQRRPERQPRDEQHRPASLAEPPTIAGSSGSC